LKRKHTWRSIARVAIAASLLASSACTSDEPKKPNASTAVAVGPAGTSNPISLNGVSVAVPPGAIQAETELVVSTPTRVDKAQSPFGLASTSVDISFKNGEQPTPGKPLAVKIPLAGNFRPDNANPQHALLYHSLPDSKGYRLQPAIIKDGQLETELTHLSEWRVVYIDGATLSSYAPPVTKPVKRENCTSEVQTKDAGKVRVSGTGWSTKKDSPVNACLYTDGDKPALSISNNMNYLLPVASTDGLQLDISSKDAEEDMVRLITRRIIAPDMKQVKGYLGREGTMTTTISAKSLPATVELVGDPSTFLAESTWIALKFLVGMLVGKPGNQVAADVKLVVESTEVLTCLKNALDISTGKMPNMMDIVDLVASKCTDEIAKALSIYVANGDWWGQAWSRVSNLVGGGADAIKNVFTAVDGIRLQFNGTIRITIKQQPVCPTAKEFQAAAMAYAALKFGSAKVKTTANECHNGWVHGYTQSWLDDAGFWGDGVQTVMHWNGNAWVVDHMAGSDALFIGEDKVCDRMPASLRKEVCIKI
jgi:hypothetical protein